MHPLNIECGVIGGLITPASSLILSLSLPCLSGLIGHFALPNLCDLNPTSWAALVAQLVVVTALKAGGCGSNPA